MSAATSPAPQANDASPGGKTLALGPFTGGGSWVFAGGGLGLLFLILTFIGMAMNPKDAGFSYLLAFTYWGGISFTSLILLMIFHATHARWVTVLRRPIEAMAASVFIFLFLFIPLIFVMKYVYVWVDPPDSLGREALKLIAGKVAYLNVKMFVVRTVIYFVLAIVISRLLCGWSLEQDATGDVMLLQKQRSLGAGGLPFIALALTFGAFDWLMSLNPTWFSTVFGVYYFGGSMVAALSLLAIITKRARAADVFGGKMNDEHTHNIGKLMLAFTCFWTYIAFSQLMLIWIAGLPDETPFYITRFNPGWRWVGALLILGHFFIPFGALLSRSLKRSPSRLAKVAGWILFIHLVDIFWLVMPSRDPEGWALRWTDVTAFLGVGLVGIAYGVSRMRGKLAIPVKDPYLAESIRYRQP